MTIVVDASVLLKLLVPEPGTELAQAALDRDEDWIAPDWLMAEVASALSRKVRSEGLPREKALRALRAAPTFVDRFAPTQPSLADAMSLSIDVGHPLYDCLYLALALAENGRMLTADAKFAAALAGTTLADYVEVLA